MNTGDILKGMLTSALNTLFLLISTFLVEHGVISSEAGSAEKIAYLAGAAATGLAYLVVLYYRKKIMHYVVELAHISSPSKPIEDIKAEAKSAALPLSK